MSILAIIAALLIEQWRPLGELKSGSTLLARATIWLERTFNAGEWRHGVVAWLVAVVPAVLVAVAAHTLLERVTPPLALLVDVAVLYLTLGFRQSSHYFTDLQTAIKADDLERARELLSEWRGEPVLPRSREEVIRLAIEEALVASHRQVYAVLLWYVLLPGPSGAVLYRLALWFARRWGGLGAFGAFARQAFAVIDWPAVRLTAVAFAVVGDFEDAVYCWRTQARQWADRNTGILLAAGAGALGVRLGMAREGPQGVEPQPELGVDEIAESQFLDSAVGLLWRTLVFWLFMLIVISAASLLG